MKKENKYRLAVFEDHCKCISNDGEWDGCYDSYWEWHIYSQSGEIVEIKSGYYTEQQAREAGELALKQYESNTEKQ